MNRVRLFVSSATLFRRRGLRTDVNGFTHITLARSEDEARGAHVAAAQQRFPDHAIEGRIATDAIDDDIVREAARALGMRDA